MEELAAEMRRRFGEDEQARLIVMLSVSPGKRRRGLPEVLRSLPGFERAIVTRHTSRVAADPREVADELTSAGVDVRVVEDPAAATARAFASAAEAAGRVLAFGSSHLVGEVRRRLAPTPAQE